MWHLVVAELTRLRWRSAVMALVAAALLLPTAIAVSQAWSTRPISEAARAEAQRELDEMKAMDLEDCLQHPRSWGVRKDLEPDELERRCQDMIGEWGTPEDWIGRSQLSLEGVLNETALGVVTVLALIGALIATTYAGHDWATGSMSNQLLFESRRERVWWGKAVALSILVAVAATLGLLLFWAVIAVTAASRSIPAPAGIWEDVAWGSVRGLVLTVGVALLTYSLTMLFRSTVATLGLMFAVTMVSTLLLAAIGLGERWMLPANMWAFVSDGYEYWDPTMPGCDGMEACTRVLSLESAALYLGTLLVVAVLLGLGSFRSRDVP